MAPSCWGSWPRSPGIERAPRRPSLSSARAWCGASRPSASRRRCGPGRTRWRATRCTAPRERLSEEDQALLTLRVDRGMSWSDVARVLLSEEEAPSSAQVSKKAAALRKRFERLIVELRALAAEQGLLDA